MRPFLVSSILEAKPSLVPSVCNYTLGKLEEVPRESNGWGKKHSFIKEQRLEIRTSRFMPISASRDVRANANHNWLINEVDVVTRDS